MAKPRDYAKEYRDYQGTPEQLHNQSERHKARRAYIKAHGEAAVKGKDVGHLTSIEDGGKNNLSNLEAQTFKKNRGWRGNKGANQPRYGK